MSRYIDKEKLKAELQKKIELSHKAKRAVIEEDFEDIINDMPTADVVEVVRCKDCKYSRPINDIEKDIYFKDVVICEICSLAGEPCGVLLDGYCNYGERKDGAEE